jgi:hypothetical protein
MTFTYHQPKKKSCFLKEKLINQQSSLYEWSMILPYSINFSKNPKGCPSILYHTLQFYNYSTKHVLAQEIFLAESIWPSLCLRLKGAARTNIAKSLTHRPMAYPCCNHPQPQSLRTGIHVVAFAVLIFAHPLITLLVWFHLSHSVQKEQRTCPVFKDGNSLSLTGHAHSRQLCLRRDGSPRGSLRWTDTSPRGLEVCSCHSPHSTTRRRVMRHTTQGPSCHVVEGGDSADWQAWHCGGCD